ncbi:MAG: DnaJ domain-containing protein [Mycoplasmataceae bacterium]|nr:DnaJ domain-containing protein [Mycoplasmataceae bacterium]
MNNFKDYYQILGVDCNASLEDIHEMYIKLSQAFHPDKNKTKFATSRMQEINEAYEVLKDKQKRQEYDEIYKNRDSQFQEREEEQTNDIVLNEEFLNDLNNYTLLKNGKEHKYKGFDGYVYAFGYTKTSTAGSMSMRGNVRGYIRENKHEIHYTREDLVEIYNYPSSNLQLLYHPGAKVDEGTPMWKRAIYMWAFLIVFAAIMLVGVFACHWFGEI